MHTIANPGLWAAFIAVVVVALAIDFLVLRQNGAHRVRFREALVWSVAWITIALVFNFGLWWWLDGHVGREIANDKALEFLTGYVVEKLLAIDNIFVFLMIFNYFAVPAEQRQRALMLGVLGAIVLRAILIFIGAALGNALAGVFHAPPDLFAALGFIAVFAGDMAGPAYLFGPTGGFIVSWILVSVIVGWAADRGLSQRLLPLFGIMLVGDAVSFAFGYAWLVVVLAGLKGVAPSAVMGAAFDGAIKPFVIWDIVKMAFAASSVAGAWSFMRRKA